VLQHYGDCLWASLGGAAAPNPGFQQGCVLPLNPDPQELAAEGISSEGGSAAAAAGGEAAGGGGGAAAAQGLAQLSLAGVAAANGGDLQQQQQQQQPSSSTTSPAEMDALLEAALLQALIKSVKEGDVPLNSSTLWSQHVLPSRPVGSTLDVRRSSHKKMSKFLQV
jgi:translation initiation factor 2D